MYELRIPEFEEPQISFQWYRSGVPIKGATKQTYSLRAEDDGCELVCRMTTRTSQGINEEELKRA